MYALFSYAPVASSVFFRTQCICISNTRMTAYWSTRSSWYTEPFPLRSSLAVDAPQINTVRAPAVQTARSTDPDPRPSAVDCAALLWRTYETFTHLIFKPAPAARMPLPSSARPQREDCANAPLCTLLSASLCHFHTHTHTHTRTVAVALGGVGQPLNSQLFQ